MYGRHKQIITNTSPTNAYRGAGRPEANYIIERLVDEAAVKLGIDPLELRRRNVLIASSVIGITLFLLDGCAPLISRQDVPSRYPPWPFHPLQTTPA